MTGENVEVPIKSGTLNLKKKVGVIPATLKPQVPRSWKVALMLSWQFARKEERQKESKKERRVGCEWMRSRCVAPGCLPGGATQ